MTDMRSMVLAAVLACAAVSAAEAKSSNFPGLRLRGTLTDSAGPVDKVTTLTVRVYAVPTGGAPLYAEAFEANLSGGNLDLLIGAGLGTTTDDLVAALTPVPGEPFERYLTMQVESEGQEFLPRQRLSAVPFAAWATAAGSAETAGGLGGLAPKAYRALADAQTSLGCVLGDDGTVSCAGKLCTDASTMNCTTTLDPMCRNLCIDGTQTGTAVISKLAANVNVPEDGLLSVHAPPLLACALDRATRADLSIVLNGAERVVVMHAVAAQAGATGAPTGRFDLLPQSALAGSARVTAGNYGSISVEVALGTQAPYSSKAMCFAIAQPTGIAFHPADIKGFTSPP